MRLLILFVAVGYAVNGSVMLSAPQFHLADSGAIGHIERAGTVHTNTRPPSHFCTHLNAGTTMHRELWHFLKPSLQLSSLLCNRKVAV